MAFSSDSWQFGNFWVGQKSYGRVLVLYQKHPNISETSLNSKGNPPPLNRYPNKYLLRFGVVNIFFGGPDVSQVLQASHSRKSKPPN